MDQTIEEKIKQRRAQMLVHSHLYYTLDTNIITDDKWQTWANELAELQNKNPNKCNINFFDKEFENWDGSSGAFLPLNCNYATEKAKMLLEMQKTEEGFIG